MKYTTHTWRNNLILVMPLLLALPCIAYAEVSDKEPSFLHLWMTGLGTALLCMMAGRLHRWLVPVAAAFPALWFLSLFMEMFSADVGPALYAEQGNMYHLSACMALISLAGGAAWGWRHGRR